MDSNISFTKNAKETHELGRKFGSSLKGGEVVALFGDLGSGKTTFVQGVASGLHIKSRIISPTFIIMRVYPIPHSQKELYHVDLYRLEGNLSEEIENIGLTDVWGKSDAIVLIEWSEKISDLLPENVIKIKFEHVKDDERKIEMNI